MALLAVKDLNAYYGSSHILQGISLTIDSERDVVGVIGKNGMGKTTLMRSIMGIDVLRYGSILFKGKETVRERTWTIAKNGIGYVPQGRQIFNSLTVWENLKIAEMKGKVHWGFELIYEYFPILKERMRNSARQLSGGEQQMLAIARGLMTNPSLLLLDEPSEGLAPLLRSLVVSIIIQVSEKNVAVLLVEQNLKMIQGASKEVYVIEKGGIVFRDNINNFHDDLDRIKRDYLSV
jgi:branched-chain amino acid transport system ATP-binding protein